MTPSPHLNGLIRAALVGVACLATTAPGAAQKICFIAELEEAQQVPPTGSAGKGTACFILDPAADSLTYQITVEGLGAAETEAHIHGFASPGSNAGFVHTLPLGPTKSGVWFYPAADEAKILAGMTYVDVHSTAFAGGELRGQILRDVSNATLIGSIDGAQGAPPSGSPATGTACFSVDTVANAITYQITVASSLLTSPEGVAHIHGFSLPGVNSGIKHNLPLGFHKQGVWSYLEFQEANILADLSYVNIHTTVFPSGEIRGQMLLAAQCAPGFTSYCTAGTSASSCTALLSASGFPSATLPSGFVLSASGVEGGKDGLFFYGTGGQQQNSWGNGSSFQCVIPPVKRAGLLSGTGTSFACDGSFSQDLNALWSAVPSKNPGAGAVVQAQLWYRDPLNTSNQTTSLSDAIEFAVCP